MVATTKTPDPDQMTPADYKYFLYLVNTRTQVLVRSLAGIDPEILVPFLRSQGANDNALTEFENLSTGLAYMTEKYEISLTDQVTPDGTIIRTPISPAAQEVADSIATSRRAPTPMQTRAQRRAAAKANT